MSRKQTTYLNQIATLFLVTTPIGNLSEVSTRMITILQTVAIIFVEDTRITKKLLTKFQITTKTSSFHKFNEKAKTKLALEYLVYGKNIALVSCAGSPLIADPGHWLVAQTLANNFNVTSVGVNSPLLVALICSGFKWKKFYFAGFIANSQAKKRAEIITWSKMEAPVIFYESVHKMTTTLKILNQLLPTRKIFLAREISKRNETFYWGTSQDLVLEKITYRGEFVFVLAPSSQP